MIPVLAAKSAGQVLGAFPVKNAVLVSAQAKRGKNQPHGKGAGKGQQRQADGGANERVKQAGGAAMAAEKVGSQRWSKGDEPM
jgi:hypothetical protein